VLAYGLQILAAGHEYDLFSRLGKPPTEITPYSAGSKDRNTHQHLATATNYLDSNWKLFLNNFYVMIGTSRTPLREAVRRLQPEGLVDFTLI
jgi:hypothetical protein